VTPRVIFITGTDTGVGKTVLSGLLLAFLRGRGCNALALKPFCSGARTDALLLRALQDNALAMDEVNPFYFKEPVAPLVAARRHRCAIALPEVIENIRHAARRCECLLIEGAGGLLAPLGEGFTARDLIARLRCETIVVARNQLGVINHTLLTVESLRGAKARSIKVVLMNPRRSDPSSKTNPRLLSEWLGAVPLYSLPWLGARCCAVSTMRANVRKLKTTLGQL
jgi:dethiobiotin synthetase